MKKWLFTAAATILSAPQIFAGPVAIIESERELPISHEVDVVVAGGGCAAVAAAQAAAEAGATVFLAAPRQYLGDDIAGTLRLWLQEGEVPVAPLAQKIYLNYNPVHSFTYKSDKPSQPRHLDKGAMLTDGVYRDVQSQSVEFSEDVVITADLGSPQMVATAAMAAFERKNDFEIDSVRLSFSADGKSWSPEIPLMLVPGQQPGALLYSTELNKSVRFVKVAVQKKPSANRILLGELMLSIPTDDSGCVMIVPTPLRVKQVMDKALINSGVQFLTGSMVTDLLRDADGNPAGIVMANRSGRQAVVAKVLIDATDQASVARMAGAKFQPCPAGPHTFTRIVIAGEAPVAEGMTARQLPGDYNTLLTHSRKQTGWVDGKAYACTMQIEMADSSFRSFANAEQVARDRTFVKSLLEGADTLFYVPPYSVKSRVAWGKAWPGADKVDLGCFQPQEVSRLYLLSGYSDVPRQAAQEMLRPLELMNIGARIGREAALEAKEIARPQGVKRPGNIRGAVAQGSVKELLRGPRPYLSNMPTVKAEATALPVLGEYDVVVVGGGTGGAPAGISAARQGARTLVLEQLFGLGGVGTLGMIGKYWYGNVCGFTAEHDKGVDELGAKVYIVGKREWWRSENRRAGADLWFGVLGCGTLVDNGKVTGVIVATPTGRGVVLAKSVIDATGNAEMAASAGATCVFQGADEIAVQGAGLSPRRLGASYINSDFSYVNDCDAVDLWLLGVRGRAGAEKAWDISQVAESRERQRVVGDYWVTPLDILNQRTFPDTVLQSRSDFDTHGYCVADITYVSEPTQTKIYSANVPYRCLLPKGIEGMMVIGLGASAHRDAMPIMRMQPDIQNQGYVAGLAGAIAVREGKTFRSIDVKSLQRQLVKDGVIPEEVLGWTDNAVVGLERLATAVKNVGDGYKNIGLVLAQPEKSLPMLRRAYERTQKDSSRLIYAHVLGIMGDATGVKTLIDVISEKVPVPEMDFQGERTFGRRVTEMDSYIIALGRTRDKRGVAPIVEVVRKMHVSSKFSQFRAVTLALEALADPSAAAPLAELLQKNGIGGHWMTDLKDATPAGGWGATSTGAERFRVLRELAVARALYRCGDYNGLAEKTFQTYTKDIRGIYALHATEVLKQGNR